MWLEHRSAGGFTRCCALIACWLTLFGCDSGGGRNSGEPPAAPATPSPPDPAPTPPSPTPTPSEPEPTPPAPPPSEPGPTPPTPTPHPEPAPPDPPPASATGPGLDVRPTNATCLAWDKPTDGDSISVERFTQLTFDSPVNMVQAPHDDSTWYVVLIDGLVHKFTGPNPTASSVFADLRGPVDTGFEAGLLGMAFHPDYPQDPRVFFKYNVRGAPWRLRISSFATKDGGRTLDSTTEQIVLTIDKPASYHNGGHLAFGPDGYLYIGVGDGGSEGDDNGERGNGQRLTTMLGKMLRIDVDATSPYGIPPTNPFAANARCPAAGRESDACPEIFAYGFRNPWRWSFDRVDGTLWLGDVGETRWEEVDIVRRGGNYGWRCREGAHNYKADTPGCSESTFEEPIAEYSHTEGNSITGGYVYRGGQPTALNGRYLFADFVRGHIWAWMDEEAPAPRRPTLLLTTQLNIVSFAESNSGELFVVHYGDEGTLHRIAFDVPEGGTVPTKLSETGCVNPQLPMQAAAGVIPYDIKAPFWSDGAQKERWLALPNAARIAVREDGDWDFPAGSVLMKSFSVGERLIETRLLMRHPDGSWGGFTYEWNQEQTDATLIRGGMRRDIGNGQTWIFPSEADCLRCHTDAAGRALGPESSQLNREITYSHTGRTANQLTTLDHIGMFAAPIGAATANPVLPTPDDTSRTLTERARAYLHTNCSQCHRPSGPTPSTMDLRYNTALAATNACDAQPGSGQLGLGADARLIAPGNAALSIIANRMNRRDQHGMPPLGSVQSDAAGVALVTEWINSLTACTQ